MKLKKRQHSVVAMINLLLFCYGGRRKELAQVLSYKKCIEESVSISAFVRSSFIVWLHLISHLHFVAFSIRRLETEDVILDGSFQNRTALFAELTASN